MLEDGSIVDMRIWRVPSLVPPATHMFKYSLFYGRPGELAVLEVEVASCFESPEQLIEDFKAAVLETRDEGR